MANAQGKVNVEQVIAGQFEYLLAVHRQVTETNKTSDPVRALVKKLDEIVRDARANGDDVLNKSGATAEELTKFLDFNAEWSNRLAVVSGVRWEIKDVKQRCADLDLFARMGLLTDQQTDDLAEFHSTFDKMRSARGSGN